MRDWRSNGVDRSTTHCLSGRRDAVTLALTVLNRYGRKPFGAGGRACSSFGTDGGAPCVAFG